MIKGCAGTAEREYFLQSYGQVYQYLRDADCRFGLLRTRLGVLGDRGTQRTGGEAKRQEIAPRISRETSPLCPRVWPGKWP